MAENISDFKEIVRKIENKQILLPDFQREFVWKDEEQQRKIVSSVLARMPIGSILLLKSKPDEYSSKIIGCKTPVNTNNLQGEVEFLLDGQQRITVLTNVFSNVIHDQCRRVSDLISPSLKRRFFLRIPKWSKCRDERDLFGVHKLIFKYQNPDSDDPEFLSGDIMPFVECFSFINDDGQSYNPQVPLSTKLDTFCISYQEGYLIPLYLLAPSEKKNKAQIVLRLDTILSNISKGIYDEIVDYFSKLDSEQEKRQFVDEIIEEEGARERIKADFSEFNAEMEERQQLWKYYLNNYLEVCIKGVSLHRIVVKEEQRARAIDIYENLNRGGVSLNTFDLIMARVAKVSSENFYQRIVSYMKADKAYTVEVLPDVIKPILKGKIDVRKYNATINTGCYNDSKNEIYSKYIDAFLDVLSLYCYNPDFSPENFKLDYIKRDKILGLTPEQINDNSEMVCRALDRALFFFQTRCGIRSMQEINYALMVVLVATVFIKDENFSNKKVHDILEAWYWAVAFSGEYDKDQNVTMINHLQAMVKTVQNRQSTEWIDKLKEYVLDAQNFSDKEFLLMEKAEDDRYPKAVLKSFMCQYLLAKTYADLFNADKKISVFCSDADNLEAHHIVPLGTVRKVGETTAQLRNNKKHVCNSPLNFVYITKASNLAVSDDSVDVYVGKIRDEAKSALHISAFKSGFPVNDETKVKELLEDRYTFLKGEVKQRIFDLLQ